MPDPELDVSGFMLASIELGIKSVSWEMVKMELLKDRTWPTGSKRVARDSLSHSQTTLNISGGSNAC